MKRNFGLSRQFYWQLPRSVRNMITDEVAAGQAIYNFIKISTGSERRRHARERGYKNFRNFLFNQMGRKNQLM